MTRHDRKMPDDEASAAPAETQPETDAQETPAPAANPARVKSVFSRPGWRSALGRPVAGHDTGKSSLPVPPELNADG
jgi:hypothetical protein